MTPLTPALRTWIYRVAATTGPLLIAFGYVTDAKWPLILALVEALIGTGTAALHAPTPEALNEIVNKVESDTIKAVSRGDIIVSTPPAGPEV